MQASVRTLGLVAALMVAVGGAIWLGRWYFADAVVPWTAAELRSITTLWIGNLPPLGPSPTNAMADDPLAAKLGHQLFFDARLSGDGKVSCSTCHQPARLFADGLRVGVGVRTTERNAMSVVGAAYSPWLFWDGRKDSLWSQALAPLESAVEHGGSRMQYAHLIQDDRTYRARYEELFGAMPDFSDRDRFPERAGPVDDAAARAAWEHMAEGDRQAVTQVFVNLGKTLEAYQRQLRPGAARFDSYVDALLAEFGSCGSETVHWRCSVHQLPQRPAPDQQRFPQHGRAHRARYAPCERPDHGREAGGRGSLQLPGPLQ
jgi:cytochrome c peroxidase